MATGTSKEKPLGQPTLHKRIALEWLYLLVALGIGLIVLPATVMLLGRGHALRFGLFYEAVIEGTDFARWVALAPYVVFQLVRLTRWAVRAANS